MEEILNLVGLTKNQSLIYKNLLRYGPTRLLEITRITKLYRSNALQSLEQLIVKGLVNISYMGKRKLYIATNPKKLLEIYEEKKIEIERVTRDLENISLAAQPPSFEIMFGKEGLRNILEDEIAVGKTINVIQSSENVELMAGAFLEKSRNMRVAAGVRMKIIYDEQDKEWAAKARSFDHTEARINGKEKSSATIDVYGNRTVIIFGLDPTIIKIIDSSVAAQFMKLFENLWKKSKPKTEQHWIKK